MKLFERNKFITILQSVAYHKSQFMVFIVTFCLWFDRQGLLDCYTVNAKLLKFRATGDLKKCILILANMWFIAEYHSNNLVSAAQ